MTVTACFFSFIMAKIMPAFTNTSSYYFEEEKETDTRERQVMAWGSTLGALRWNHIVSNRLFHNITLSYNRFRFNIKKFSRPPTNTLTANIIPV